MALTRLTYTDNSDIITIGSINSDASNDYIVYANGGNDKLDFHIDGSVYMDMGSGNDTVYANGSGAGQVFGGQGNDWLQHNANSVDDGVFKLYGGTENDRVQGLAGAADLLYGGSGNDTMVAGSGNVAYGGTGDDFYELQQGAVFYEAAGQGYDTVRANFATFNFTGSNIEAFISTSTTGVTITGDANGTYAGGYSGADKLSMGAGNDDARGGLGNDWIYAGTGNDTVMGNEGADHMYGEDGNDLLRGDLESSNNFGNADSIYGGNGNDTLVGGSIGQSGDLLDGGAGDDLYQEFIGYSYIVELANGGIDTVESKLGTFTLSANLENLKLIDTYSYNAATGIYSLDVMYGEGNDLGNVITGGNAANFISGLDGQDTINAGGGNDSVRGGNHADLLDGGADQDTMDGGSGNDRVYGGTGHDTLNGDAGYDTVYGGDGVDLIYGGSESDELAGNAAEDRVYGGSGNDIDYGGDDQDQLFGDDGYDTLYGENGNDYLSGGGNTDALYGNDGNDYLTGGTSGDILNGGLGADTFAFYTLADSVIGTGIDKIQDFKAAEGDKIDLHEIDADTTEVFNSAFVWKGMSLPEAAQAGNLWGQHFAAMVYNPEFVRVYGDVNGDNVADFSIDVQNLATLDALAFIL